MNIYNYVDQPVSQRQQTTNLRTYTRNIPSHTLQPYLDARPVMSKYAFLPVNEHRTQAKTLVYQQPTYSQESVYNPGDRAPWSGYSSNINHESELRNQIYALQDCSQAVYVPSSNSSLYQWKWTQNNKQIQSQPFPSLFETTPIGPRSNPQVNSDKIGFGLFNNATRQQTKDLTQPTRCK